LAKAGEMWNCSSPDVFLMEVATGWSVGRKGIRMAKVDPLLISDVHSMYPPIRAATVCATGNVDPDGWRQSMSPWLHAHGHHMWRIETLTAEKYRIKRQVVRVVLAFIASSTPG
jgi:hypothetical protein